jgi:hypothetical protein
LWLDPGWEKIRILEIRDKNPGSATLQYNAGRAIRTFFNANFWQILCLPLAYVYTVLGAPPVLRTLFYADLFSWIGIMAHGMFYTGDSHNRSKRHPLSYSQYLFVFGFRLLDISRHLTVLVLGTSRYVYVAVHLFLRSIVSLYCYLVAVSFIWHPLLSLLLESLYAVACLTVYPLHFTLFLYISHLSCTINFTLFLYISAHLL